MSEQEVKDSIVIPLLSRIFNPVPAVTVLFEGNTQRIMANGFELNMDSTGMPFCCGTSEIGCFSIYSSISPEKCEKELELLWSVALDFAIKYCRNRNKGLALVNFYSKPNFVGFKALKTVLDKRFTKVLDFRNPRTGNKLSTYIYDLTQHKEEDYSYYKIKEECLTLISSNPVTG